MFEPFCKTVISRFILAATLSASLAASGAVYAQAVPTAVKGGGRHEIQVGLTYEASGANLTYASPATFFMQGGEADISTRVYKIISAVGSFSGMHAGNSGQGIPVNLLVYAFGPRLTTPRFGVKYPVRFFGQALGGGAHGFDGLYPEASGPSTSASSYALELGGGLDLEYKPRFDIRLLQVDWLRTGLPNATTSVENTVRFGIGIVIRNKAR